MKIIPIILVKGLFLACILAAAPSCIYQNKFESHCNIKNAQIPLLIELPRNKNVFENVAPVIYETLCHHFRRIGYRLVNRPEDGYVLRVTIKSLDPTTKFVSPDVLLFHSHIKLELACELFDFNNTLVSKKTFSYTYLISKSRNPILMSDFLNHEYKVMITRVAPTIEHFFRKILLDRFA